MAPIAPLQVHNIAHSIPQLINQPLIEQNPAQSAGALITLLSDGTGDAFQIRPTGPTERLDVIQRMLQFGTLTYYKHFTDDIRGREILAAWLSDATPPRRADAEDVSDRYRDVLPPLLELLLRLPIQLVHLKDHVGLGKLITGAQKRARSEQARRLADSVKDKWSALVPPPAARNEPRRALSPPAASKRPAPAASDANAKRIRSSPAVRGESPQLDGAPSDVRRPRTTSTSNANKELASFMSLIDSQPASTPAVTSEPLTSAPQRKKRKKSVRWKDHDGLALVAVKLIEPAIYEDTYGGHAASGAGALDMEEGGAFRQAHAEMDEQIDWYSPRELILPKPTSGAIPVRGSRSEAKVAQEEREKSVLTAVYLNNCDIPESPAEPDEFVLAFAAVGPEPRAMTLGPSLKPFSTEAATAAEAPEAPGLPPAMAAMLGQLMQNIESSNDAPCEPAIPA